MTPYRPRRATKRWLEGAPEYILDVFDWGPKFVDRYWVLFGGSLLEPALLEHRKVFGLGMSAQPAHPLGVSMWGETPPVTDQPTAASGGWICQKTSGHMLCAGQPRSEPWTN